MDITAAIDESAADSLLDSLVSSIPVQTASGSGSLGPFTASYNASASFTNGDVDLIAPSTVRIQNFRVDWSVGLSFTLDLSSIIPDFCLPQVCVNIPCVGRVCTPAPCINWPSVTINVPPVGDFLNITADLGLSATLVGSDWEVDATIQGVPNLQFGAASAVILAAIGAAIVPAVIVIPFIGPFVAAAVAGILAAIGIAGVTGLLGPIITPFVAGLAVTIYKQPQTFQAIAAAGPNDPAVFVSIDDVQAEIQSTNEDELVVTVDVS
ncbi:MAG: hypothetical protein AAF531_06315 [Actinomycetota bacterium]